MKYICPKGHELEVDDSDTVQCDQCKLVATHYNRVSGEVYQWTPRSQYLRNCERLQEEMDDAFENQYFSGGW
jgi:hypothetical protein